ncbi:hypothetical protein [Oleisolibacter albus]|uniref:hypothetical protein n=1 Tax=Oleisolibacter albus TaxID=2171757 RepID=UPI000DF1965A|nr:hypothetical protein [Oleisolibacter albus]
MTALDLAGRPSSVPPAAPATTGRHRRDLLPLGWLWFALGLLLCAGQVQWVLQAGYVTDTAADRWRTALLAASDASAFRDLFAITFPPLPLMADLLLGLLPGTGGVPLPVLVNVLAGAGLAAAWAGQIASGGYGRAVSGLAALLLLAHPALQQAIAAGDGTPLALLALTLMIPALIRVRRAGDVNAMALVGSALALMLFSAPSGAYLVLALLPALVALAPPSLMVRSVLGVLLVLLFPVLFTLGGYLYTNWIFGGSALAFAASVDAAIRGAAADLGRYPWLMLWSHDRPAGLAAVGLMLLGSVPLLPVAVARIHDRHARWTVLLLAASVLAAILIASVSRYLDHPGQMLPYLLPVLAMGAAAARPARLPASVLLLLLTLGLRGGWTAQDYAAAPAGAAWQAAMRGSVVAESAAAQDNAFGKLLRGYQDVAIDATVSGLVVPARGTAEGLLLTSTDRLKADLLAGALSSRYVAVQDPDTPRGLRDRIGRALAGVWRDGPPGATLVAAIGPWRLWRLPDRPSRP